MDGRTLSDLHRLAEEMGVSEEEIVRSGIRQLPRERALAAYVRGKLSRGEALDRLGINWVKMADCQREAVEEDLARVIK